MENTLKPADNSEPETREELKNFLTRARKKKKAVKQHVNGKAQSKKKVKITVLDWKDLL